MSRHLSYLSRIRQTLRSLLTSLSCRTSFTELTSASTLCALHNWSRRRPGQCQSVRRLSSTLGKTHAQSPAVLPVTPSVGLPEPRACTSVATILPLALAVFLAIFNCWPICDSSGHDSATSHHRKHQVEVINNIYLLLRSYCVMISSLPASALPSCPHFAMNE